MGKGDVVNDPAGAEVVLGDVGSGVVFENNRLRVWEVLLDPGQSQPWHRHHHPYLVVALEAADNRIVPIDGSDPLLVHESVGRVIVREPGETHMLTNSGATRYRSRLIELKDCGA